MRTLITGASGFIGSHVAAALAAGGAEIRAFCRSEPPAAASAAEWVPGDVRDTDALRSAARGCQAIMHVAAVYSYARGDASLIEEVNIKGTGNVLAAAVSMGVRRVVVTSSSATCGPVPGRRATEADSPPEWELSVPYKRSKLEAERLALAARRDGIDVLCVNPTTTLGPDDRLPTPSGKMIRDLVEGKIRGYLQNAGVNVVSVEDVARGHALALEHGRSGHRYILGGDDLSLHDLFATAAAAVGRPAPRLGLPWPPVYGAAVVVDAIAHLRGQEPQLLVRDEVRLARLPLYFSSDKAKRELGYDPGPAAQAVAAAARWFESAAHDRVRRLPFRARRVSRLPPRGATP